MSAPSADQGIDLGAVRFGPDGLIPGVVQDVADGTVLMVAYLDGEALAATLQTGLVHFHSRSRGRLWRKGETSGNVLRLRELRLDCDGDALLLRVEPAGPACHTGARSCFDASATTEGGSRQPDPAGAGAPALQAAEGSIPMPQGFDWLEQLWSTIEARAASRPQGSYTTRLLEGGVDAVARKVTEEATEVLMAAKDDAVAVSHDHTRAALAGEMADLLYHLLVLAAERDLPPAAVLAVLRARHRARVG